MRVALTSCPPNRAEDLAKALVEAGAACVTALGSGRSVYRWNGALQVDDEALLVVKVAEEAVASVQLRLREVHPYQLPEFVTLPVDVDLSSAAYIAWVRSAARNSGGP
jgi:periplasmic divalent cation tolerance protein